MDFVRAHFDKFLLSLFVVYFSVLGLHGLHHGVADSKFMEAMLDNEKLVIGALLGLITGRAMERLKNGGPPPNGPSK